MFHLPMTRSWIVSRTARHVYTFCAIATLALIWMQAIISIFLQSAGLRNLGDAPFAAPLFTPPVVIGWLSVAILWAAMWYFWLSFDKDSVGKKSVWLLH